MVLGITEEDFAEFHRVTPNLLTELLPMVAEKCPAGPGPAKRRHLLFLGSFSNLANRDGLGWFLERVWPRIRKRLPNVEMRLAGSSMPDFLRAPGNGIVGLGHVSHLGRVFAQYRVFVSPIRYGTGIKTKNVAALAHGIPVVTTTIGAEGIGLRDGETVSIADDEESFEEAVVRLYQDDNLWRKRAKASREHMLQNFSPEQLMAKVARLIDRARTLQPKAFDPNHVPSYLMVERFFPEVLAHMPGNERPGVRLVAYVHLGERLLAQGDAAGALAQYRHAFHYLRGEIPNVSIFGRLLQGLERTYRALGDSESVERCVRQQSKKMTDAREPVVEVKTAARRRIGGDTRCGVEWERGRATLRGASVKPRLAFSIIVRNAARDLPQCLESVRGVVDEMVVADTGSTDDTIAVARAAGACVVSIPWENDFAKARNRALTELRLHTAADWVLTLDADEMLDSYAAEAIAPLLRSDEYAGYTVPIRNYFRSLNTRIWDCAAVENDGRLPESRQFPAFVAPRQRAAFSLRP